MTETQRLHELQVLMDEHFKFGIGQLVQFASYEKLSEKDDGFSKRFDRSTEIRGIVVERLLQQCHRGIQKVYRVRWGGKSGTLDKVAEPELKASE